VRDDGWADAANALARPLPEGSAQKAVGRAGPKVAPVAAPPVARTLEARRASVDRPPAQAEPPVTQGEVRGPVPSSVDEQDVQRRRERLKERLRAVRENPRPEPLPATVAEAGVLVVERISTLQAELTQLKALNQALAQDLDAARRTSERATEEA